MSAVTSGHAALGAAPSRERQVHGRGSDRRHVRERARPLRVTPAQPAEAPWPTARVS